jgi:hypothetical protein
VSRVHGPVDYGNSAGPQEHHGLMVQWVVRLTGLGMFSSSGQWELAATKGKARGEQHGSHQGLQRPGEMEGWNPSWGWKWGQIRCSMAPFIGPRREQSGRDAKGNGARRWASMAQPFRVGEEMGRGNGESGRWKGQQHRFTFLGGGEQAAAALG